MSIPRLFISPSDQPANVGALDIHEQHYAQIRARRLEAAIHKYAAGRVTTRISQEGIGDSGSGYATSVREGNRWGHDDYHAEHSNATGSAVKASGVHVYIWPSDPRAYRWAQAIIARIGHYFGGKPAIRDGSHLMEVNSSHGTAVLNECGFHDNPADAIVTQPTDTNPDQTLADVYAYKIATMPPAPKRPGEDESAVTDPMLLHAVQRVITKIHANLAPSSEPQPAGE